jgi:DNA end-binding protein Ku
MPARSIDTATLAFGLVSIPVKIYTSAERSEEIHFHYVHQGCGERLKQQYICPEHGPVERDDMVKGFELSKNNFVELDKQELKALEAVTTDEIALAEFVPAGAVDPLYVDKTYYLGPNKGGERAYRLFRDAIETSELVGIATYAARGKQHVVMVRPYEDGLVMHQLRYPDEVKPWSEIPIGKLPKPAPSELGLATKVIDQLRHETFDPAQYTDDVKQRVRELIAEKAKGGEIVAPEHAPRPEPGDLMAALKASLGAGGNGVSTNKNGDARSKKSTRSHARGHTRRGTARARPHASRKTRGTRSQRAHR